MQAGSVMVERWLYVCVWHGVWVDCRRTHLCEFLSTPKM